MGEGGRGGGRERSIERESKCERVREGEGEGEGEKEYVTTPVSWYYAKRIETAAGRARLSGETGPFGPGSGWPARSGTACKPTCRPTWHGPSHPFRRRRGEFDGGPGACRHIIQPLRSVAGSPADNYRRLSRRSSVEPTRTAERAVLLGNLSESGACSPVATKRGTQDRH